MTRVRLEQVTRRFKGVVAVDDLSLDVRDGEFLTLLGPSGCGKTTTLRMVAGFIFPSSGRIQIGEENVTTVPANSRDIGMVFQSYALFPHLSVARNVAFGLKMRNVRREEAARRVKEALDLVHLTHLAERLPKELSGGQQQRVALARAVVIKPRVLLMDEPLGALDLKLRQELQVQIKKVQREVGITTIYVTHDQGEALSLSDRVAVMHNGRMLQLDQPEALYTRPRSAFVAKFVGRTNLLPVEVANGSDNPGATRGHLRGDAGGGDIALPATDMRLEPRQRCTVGFRPENARIGAGGPNRMSAVVDEIRYFGAVRSVILRSASGAALEVDLPSSAPAPNPRETVAISWRPEDSFLLPSEE